MAIRVTTTQPKKAASVPEPLRAAVLAVLDSARTRVYKARTPDDLEVVRRDLEAVLEGLALRAYASSFVTGLPLFPAA